MNLAEFGDVLVVLCGGLVSTSCAGYNIERNGEQMVGFPEFIMDRAEYPIQYSSSLEDWRQRFIDRLDDLVISTGGDYGVGEVKFSQSHQFPVIIRAEVEWRVGNETVVSTEMIWMNNANQTGEASSIRGESLD